MLAGVENTKERQAFRFCFEGGEGCFLGLSRGVLLRIIVVVCLLIVVCYSFFEAGMILNFSEWVLAKIERLRLSSGVAFAVVSLGEIRRNHPWPL